MPKRKELTTEQKLVKAWDDITSVPDATEEDDTYGLFTVEIDGETYAIGTDEEADKAVSEAIDDMLWAFQAKFIASQCGLPNALIPAIEAWQREECESCNDDVRDMIKDYPAFVDAAVASDGRGHFLAQYDNEEIELEGSDGELLFAYRIS